MALIPSDPYLRLPILRLRSPREVYRALKRTLERLVDKRLGAGALGSEPGGYCALGALYVALAYPEGCQPFACPDLDAEISTGDAIDRLVEPHAAHPHRVRDALRRVFQTNDRQGYVTPEERYALMLAWVDARLATDALPSSPDALEGDTPA